MLDLGFSKIAVIGVVALIVLGPERLPRVARMAGALYGRAQRYLRDVKDEVSRDMELSQLKELGKNIQSEVVSAEQSVREVVNDVQQQLGQPYTRQTYIEPISRTGRAHWRVKTARVPLWYKHQTGVKTRLTTEAARMSKHRQYAAHQGKPRHSFFS